MKRFLEFLEDDSGRLSNVRLIGLLISGGFMADWMAHVIRSLEFDPTWSTVSLVASVIGAKVLQKGRENKKNS